MKLNKTLLALALVSGVAVAHPMWHHGKKPNFNEVKARIITILNKRISFLQGREACVQKAQNWKELRGCRPKQIRMRMRRGIHRNFGR